MNIKEILESLPKVDFENPTRKNTEDLLKKYGIPDIMKPDAVDLKFPSDVTTVADETLGQLIGQYYSWTGYLESLLAQKEADILLVKNAISRVIKNYVGKDKIKKADAERAEAVLALEGVMADLEIQYKIVAARHRFFDACGKALSRELSRRTAKPGRFNFE